MDLSSVPAGPLGGGRFRTSRVVLRPSSWQTDSPCGCPHPHGDICGPATSWRRPTDFPALSSVSLVAGRLEPSSLPLITPGLPSLTPHSPLALLSLPALSRVHGGPSPNGHSSARLFPPLVPFMPLKHRQPEKIRCSHTTLVSLTPQDRSYPTCAPRAGLWDPHKSLHVRSSSSLRDHSSLQTCLH